MTQVEFNNHREAFIWDDPIDHIEPLLSPADQLRDAQMMTVHLLNDFATEMLSALSGENPVKSSLTKLFGIAFAMGLSICDDGVSMAETARRIGVERATISKVATFWNQSHELSPSFHQKSAEANEHYAEARRAVVNGNGHAKLPVPPTRHRSV